MTYSCYNLFGDYMERLQKVIAASGICSRRKAEDLIKDGKVMVNGKVITTLGTKVNSSDNILVDGKKIINETKVYYLLNKPRGVICSLSDEKNRETVIDLVKETRRIFPVGRLDYDTTGLIILTNDGELANILMHPSNEVEKGYVVKIEGKLNMENYHKIKNGITIENKKVIPQKIKIQSYDKKTDTSIIKISLVEGMNHIVKKIFDQVKHPVIKLKREIYGPLTLGNISSGFYRELTEEEVIKLYSYKK